MVEKLIQSQLKRQYLLDTEVCCCLIFKLSEVKRNKRPATDEVNDPLDWR